MIPRTVLVAQEVAAQLSSTQLNDYGNVILNGYLSVIPNTINKKAWQYKETTTAPVDLPSLTTVQPVLKGWTTNYMEYYTKLQPNGYGVNPGDPTMFGYNVHSFSKPTGPIKTLGGNGTWITGGTGYTPGSYPNVPLTGGSGTGATANIVVQDLLGTSGPIVSWTQTASGQGYPAGAFIANAKTAAATGNGYGAEFSGSGAAAAPYNFTIFNMVKAGDNYSVGDVLIIPGGSYVAGTAAGTPIDALVQVNSVGLKGVVTSVTIVNPGTGYTEGDALTAAVPGGTGFAITVGAIVPTASTGGEPQWAQVPRRFFQNQVAPFVPPNVNQKAIPYSFMYPIVDNPVEPPIDTL